MTLASIEQRRRIVSGLLGGPVAPLDDVVRALVGYQTSWLGDEELRVHADAAGELDRAESLIDLTRRYLAALDGERLVDDGGAVVQAGLLLRDDDVLAAERGRFDEVVVDDLQLATFAEHRLLVQLVGRGGPLVVGGNPDAAVSSAPLASDQHLARFDRRFACPTIELRHPHRTPGVPTLHLADGDEDARAVEARARAAGAQVLHRAGVEAAVGREWPVVVVTDASAGRWPPPHVGNRWFDEELFHGPDVPDEAERAAVDHRRERNAFRVAVTRATEHTIVIAPPPPTPFLDALLR